MRRKCVAFTLVSVTARFRRLRAKLAERRLLNLAYRIVVGVVGTLVLLVGMLAIPYPCPGWATVFAGFAILATEFDWARSTLRWVKQRYERFTAWYRAQNLLVRIGGVLITTAVVIATLWLLGVFAMVGGWFDVDWPWLSSPL